MKSLCVTLLLVVCLFAVYGNCKGFLKKSIQDPVKWRNGKKSPGCCWSYHHYKNLLTKSLHATKQCKRLAFALNTKVTGLIRALDSQQNIFREVPPNSAPLTYKEINIRKDRIARIFRETDFTTTSRPITTPTTKSTTTTTHTTKAQTLKPTRYNPYPWTYYAKPKYHNSKYDEIENEDEDEDEEENDHDEWGDSYNERLLDELPRKRKRRMVEDEDEASCKACPQDQATILAGIIGLPGGSTASYVSCKPSQQKIGKELARGCTECHYQIDLPVGFHPKTHRHIICPSSEEFCFGGLGKCTKSVVMATVFKDTQDPATQFQWDSQRRIDFNKGCCCQLISPISNAIGDGN